MKGLTRSLIATVVIGSGALLRGRDGPGNLPTHPTIAEEKPGSRWFGWITHGHVYWVTITYKNKCALYLSSNGVFKLLQDDVNALAYAVNEELDVSARELFVRDKILIVLPDILFEPHELIISEAYRDLCRRTVPFDWPTKPSPEEIQKSLELLSHFANPSLATNGNDWKWTFFVTGETGVVECWQMSGTYLPFTINLKKDRTAPPGTLLPRNVWHASALDRASGNRK